METEHFILLGVARPRTQWLTDIGQWSTSSMLPIEFIRCVSVDEVRARLLTDRRHSAVLLGEDCAGVDRDVLEAARDAKCAPIIVSSGIVRRDWKALGAAGVVVQPVTPTSLMAVLREHAFGIERRTMTTDPNPTSEVSPIGRLITVLGGGGTGTSTTAMALAASFAQTHNLGLLDASLHGDQARLHDLGDVVPGLQELVDLHRVANPNQDEIRAHFWFSPTHGYRVLPGLRRHRDWTSLRRRAALSALTSARRCFDIIVADTDADLEGEAQTGSIDIEDRNLLARELARDSDLVVLTARPGVVGISRAIQIVLDLVELGVETNRILLVVIGAPRSTRARSEFNRTFLGLCREALKEQSLPTPVLIPMRRDVEPFIHDSAPPPRSVVSAITAAAVERLKALEPRQQPLPSASSPIDIVPGHLGRIA
ncbi:MAG: hypothetical protein WEA11_09385 [Acidimicrobiales bacterium]